ncbi:hypothetical protein [Enterocloster alcoholdehydrogenati]|uniref:hypothetical protein n=1 Tax=Enterocloster alcoholdehydrogenati TaxID=2547410 RepID=UPI00159437F5|nr:hypothetical protein [Enterocloster alcoholdehydrogenati]
MTELQDVKCGWEFMAKLMGDDLASRSAYTDYTTNVLQNQQIAAQNLHIQEINIAIDELARNINEHPHLNLGVEQFKGYVAEEFVSGTFNIDALKKGSKHMAFTLQDNGYGSVDIGTNFGKSYSLKYSNLAEKAENYQAILNKETHLPKYQGQERLIAPEQVDEAKAYAARRAIKDMYTRPDVSASHKDTGDHLVGVVSDGEGVQSQELSIKEAKAIAKEAKNGGFDPEKHGISKEVYLAEVRVDYLNQAVKAGLTAATITAITQLVPELYKAIDYLIKHGEITLNQLKKAGCKVISTSGEAFLRGSIAYGVEMAIQEGLFGEGLKAVNPSVVGVAVTVILGTIKDSLLVATGKMTSTEMGIQFVDTLVVSSGYLVSMKIGGVIAQALFPELPGIGFAIGSLLGCSVAVVYNIGKKKLISFCVDTGFTCFGLVEQNYELPDEVLKELGIDTVKIGRAKVRRTQIKRTEATTNVGRTSYETVNMTVLRRGVIGVNKIGYVL